MQDILTSKGIGKNLPIIFKVSSTVKNLIFILAALLSFSLWFAAALQTPKRLEKVEENLHLLTARQQKTEGQIFLIYQDTKTIKNILINRSNKNDK
ncbi:MAG: hypothetical protein K6E94_00225 [Elusimicrobiaceae bacterium]|nr:hypothetical protein [Elusimicrobiaceae bacterium]